MIASRISSLRRNLLNKAPLRRDGQYVLYWMIAARRPFYNFALQRAVEYAIALNKPLVIFEALRSDYPWASERFHRFVIDGMADHAAYFQQHCVTYVPFVERGQGEGKGLLAAFANDACVVITDEFPCFFLPNMVASAANDCPVMMELVDGNGVIPLRAPEREFKTAHAFRRYLHKTLPSFLDPRAFPHEEPLNGVTIPKLKSLPSTSRSHWKPASIEWLDRPELSSLPIDHRVRSCAQRGGFIAAREFLKRFDLQQYASSRNHPDASATSGCSPYLHFGHLSVFEIMRDIIARESWSVDCIVEKKSRGERSGWWQMSEGAEAFMDQLITWRELCYNTCFSRRDYDQFSSLPLWAQRTLTMHANDPRETIYTLEQFEQAKTHDEVWNAAQRELIRDGRIHNYLRMLWGKKIVEWTSSPQEALAVMIELNNKYALDGRNPNSYGGIFWVLGRYDRPWGPERPVFGFVRYMSSTNTAKKVTLKQYLARYADMDS